MKTLQVEILLNPGVLLAPIDITNLVTKEEFDNTFMKARKEVAVLCVGDVRINNIDSVDYYRFIETEIQEAAMPTQEILDKDG